MLVFPVGDLPEVIIPTRLVTVNMPFKRDSFSQTASRVMVLRVLFGATRRSHKVAFVGTSLIAVPLKADTRSSLPFFCTRPWSPFVLGLVDDEMAFLVYTRHALFDIRFAGFVGTVREVRTPISVVDPYAEVVLFHVMYEPFSVGPSLGILNDTVSRARTPKTTTTKITRLAILVPWVCSPRVKGKVSACVVVALNPFIAVFS